MDSGRNLFFNKLDMSFFGFNKINTGTPCVDIYRLTATDQQNILDELAAGICDQRFFLLIADYGNKVICRVRKYGQFYISKAIIDANNITISILAIYINHF